MFNPLAFLLPKPRTKFDPVTDHIAFSSVADALKASPTLELITKTELEPPKPLVPNLPIYSPAYHLETSATMVKALEKRLADTRSEREGVEAVHVAETARLSQIEAETIQTLAFYSAAPDLLALSKPVDLGTVKVVPGPAKRKPVKTVAARPIVNPDDLTTLTPEQIANLKGL